MIRRSSPGRSKRFYHRQNVEAGSGAHPTPCSVRTGGSFSALQWSVLEVQHLPPSSVKVENERSGPLRLHSMHRKKFTFSLTADINVLYSGYRVSLHGVKRPGAWRWPPTPSSAQVKETIELYLYSSSGPSWPFLV